LPEDDIFGVTVILLICSYRNQEFIRIGYYVNNEYDDPELNSMPPEKPIIEKLKRNILQDKPRVTKVPILWDSSGNCEIEDQPPQDTKILREKYVLQDEL
jgi:histone chaperone ASF1